MNEKITILFPLYKENVEIVRIALNSILNQSFKDFVVRIRLDAPDNIKLKNYILYMMTKDSRIQFNVNKENYGLAKTLNLMMSTIETKYVARMDADDISFVDRLKKQYEYMEANQDIDLCGTNIIYVDENGKKIKSNGRIPHMHEDIKEYLKYANCMAHPTFFMRSNVIAKIKYREDLKYAQDYEFVCRCVEMGFKLSNLNEYLLFYRVCELSPAKLLRQNLIAYYVKKFYRHNKLCSFPPIANMVEQYIIDKGEKQLLNSISLKKSFYNLLFSKNNIKDRFYGVAIRKYRIDLLYSKIRLFFLTSKER